MQISIKDASSAILSQEWSGYGKEFDDHDASPQPSKGFDGLGSQCPPTQQA